MSSYAGRRVFITGGSAGIGREAALQLARKGASVMVCARREGPLDETVEALRAVAGASGQVFDRVAADVTDPESMRAAAARAAEVLGGVDLLIANTGFAECSAVLDADDAHFRRLMDVNYFGHVHTIRAFLPGFVQARRGDIVLVSSMLAILSVYGYGAYSASKFAVRGFAEALRQEMLHHDVRVKLFLPPTTDTPGLARENEEKPPLVREMEMNSSFNATHSAEKVVERMLAWIPGRRFVGYATWDSWFQYFSARHMPELTLRVADMEMRGAQRRLDGRRGGDG